VLSATPSASAISEFGALYQKHYGIVLPSDEAAKKLVAFLGLLAAVRQGASTCGAAPDACGCFRGHREVTR
jgi:hypothetical protein